MSNAVNLKKVNLSKLLESLQLIDSTKVRFTAVGHDIGSASEYFDWAVNDLYSNTKRFRERYITYSDSKPKKSESQKKTLARSDEDLKSEVTIHPLNIPLFADATRGLIKEGSTITKRTFFATLTTDPNTLELSFCSNSNSKMTQEEVEKIAERQSMDFDLTDLCETLDFSLRSYEARNGPLHSLNELKLCPQLEMMRTQRKNAIAQDDLDRYQVVDSLDYGYGESSGFIRNAPVQEDEDESSDEEKDETEVQQDGLFHQKFQAANLEEIPDYQVFFGDDDEEEENGDELVNTHNVEFKSDPMDAGDPGAWEALEMLGLDLPIGGEDYQISQPSKRSQFSSEAPLGEKSSSNRLPIFGTSRTQPRFISPHLDRLYSGGDDADGHPGKNLELELELFHQDLRKNVPRQRVREQEKNVQVAQQTADRSKRETVYHPDFQDHAQPKVKFLPKLSKAKLKAQSITIKRSIFTDVPAVPANARNFLAQHLRPHLLTRLAGEWNILGQDRILNYFLPPALPLAEFKVEHFLSNYGSNSPEGLHGSMMNDNFNESEDNNFGGGENDDYDSGEYVSGIDNLLRGCVQLQEDPLSTSLSLQTQTDLFNLRGMAEDNLVEENELRPSKKHSVNMGKLKRTIASILSETTSIISIREKQNNILANELPSNLDTTVLQVAESESNSDHANHPEKEIDMQFGGLKGEAHFARFSHIVDKTAQDNIREENAGIQKAYVAMCFLGLLFSANERNLELRKVGDDLNSDFIVIEK